MVAYSRDLFKKQSFTLQTDIEVNIVMLPSNHNGTDGITVKNNITVATKSSAGERRATAPGLNKNKQTEAPWMSLCYQRELTGFKTDNPSTWNVWKGMNNNF